MCLYGEMARKRALPGPLNKIVDTALGAVKDPKGTAEKAVGQAKGTAALGRMVAEGVAGQVVEQVTSRTRGRKSADAPHAESPQGHLRSVPDTAAAEPDQATAAPEKTAPSAAPKPTAKKPASKKPASKKPAPKKPAAKPTAKKTTPKAAPAAEPEPPVLAAVSSRTIRVCVWWWTRPLLPICPVTSSSGPSSAE